MHIVFFLPAIKGNKGPAGAGTVYSVFPGEPGVLALKAAIIHKASLIKKYGTRRSIPGQEPAT